MTTRSRLVASARERACRSLLGRRSQWTMRTSVGGPCRDARFVRAKRSSQHASPKLPGLVQSGRLAGVGADARNDVESSSDSANSGADAECRVAWIGTVRPSPLLTDAGAVGPPTARRRAPAGRPVRASREAEPVCLHSWASGTVRQPQCRMPRPALPRSSGARVSRRIEASSDAAGVGCSRVGRHRGPAGRAS
jgi:hypothetical protein